MGIKHIDSIGEKKGALGRLDLTKKGLRRTLTPLIKIIIMTLGRLDLTKKGLRPLYILASANLYSSSEDLT